MFCTLWKFMLGKKSPTKWNIFFCELICLFIFDIFSLFLLSSFRHIGHICIIKLDSSSLVIFLTFSSRRFDCQGGWFIIIFLLYEQDVWCIFDLLNNKCNEVCWCSPRHVSERGMSAAAEPLSASGARTPAPPDAGPPRTAGKHTVHWFRKGLRLHDNPALREGLNGAITFRCVFIIDPWFASSSNVGINKWRFVYVISIW